MNDKLDAVLFRYYERFGAGHERLRRELLDRLQAEAEPPHGQGEWKPGARQRATLRRRWLLPAVVSGVAAAFALVLLPSILTPRAGGVSWAKVVENLRRPQTLTCLSTQESRNPDGSFVGTPGTVREYLRAPDQWRWEDAPTAPASRPSLPSSDPFLYWLVNATGRPGTSLTLHRDTASVMTDVTFGLGPGSLRPGLGEWLTRLRNIGGEHMTRKGEEKVGGQTLVRFEGPSEACDSTMPGGTLTVWVDPVKALPVRLLLKGPAPFVRGSQQMTIDMSAMEFDRPFKDDLFTWPDLTAGGRRVEQTLAVHVPWHIPTGKLRLTIGPSDGAALVSAADLVPRTTLADFAGRRLFLVPKAEAVQRVSEYAASHVGQKLKVSVADVGSEEVEIFGRIDVMRVTVPVEQVPATAPSPATSRPAGAAGQQRVSP